MAGIRQVAIADSSAIIALCGIGELALLDRLFDQLYVPAAVWAELLDKQGAAEGQALVQLEKLTVEVPAGQPPVETGGLA